jgi:hypothetical protein
MEADLGIDPASDRKDKVMNLVDRYLASVRRNLPGTKAEDIAAELADALQSRIEDREGALGRPLESAETSAILRNFGHPLVVAARYRGQQYLIGPEVFPFYLFALRIVLATSVALLVGMATLALVLGDSRIVRVLLDVATSLWSFFFLAIAIVTLVFAILERRGFPAEHLAKWRPEQLPDALDRPQSQWNAAFEVGLGLAFILWWTGMVALPPMARGGGLIAPAPVWETYHLPILLLAIVQLAVNLVKWVRPRWRVVTGLATIGVSVFTLVIVAGLQRAGSWVAVAPAAAGNPQAAKVAESVDLALQIAFVVVAVLMVFQLLGEIWKLVRARLQRGVSTPASRRSTTADRG